MKFGLEEHIIDKLIAIFEENAKVDKALMFGSRAMGNYRLDSDIDIALKGQDLNTDDIIAISVAFEEKGITHKIDLINYHTIKETDLKDHIDRVGIELYSRWKEYTLGEICNKITDGAHQSPRDFINGRIMFSVKDMIDNGFDYTKPKTISQEDFIALEKQGCKPEIDDILIAKDGSVLKHIFRVVNEPDYVLLSSIAILKPKKVIVDPSFLVYTLKNPKITETILTNFVSGSGVPRIVLKDFKKVDISLPPLQEQIAIASILSSLDDKIDLLHRQNKTLEQLAETLFRKWFVEEAEESWEVGTLDDEFDFVMGQSPLGSDLNEDKIGTIFYQGRSDFGFRFPRPRVYTTAPTRLANPLDTLISVRAPVGDMNMAFEECCLGRGVAAFRFKSNPNFYSYTYYKLRSLMQSIKQFEDNGSVFGSIGKEDFKNLENIIPPQNFIEQFQKEAKPIDDKILLNEQQIRSLTQTRDTLLPKLMSGEVRVKV